MPVSNRKYGIEIEAYGLTHEAAARALVNAGIYASIRQYDHTTLDHWKVTTDGSIDGIRPFEVVSPVLRGEEGFVQIKKVMDALASAGAMINASCGLHVHIDAHGLTGVELKNIVKRYARWEDKIDSFMPFTRRANNNDYCKTVKTDYLSAVNHINSDDPRAIAEHFSGSNRNRRYKVNLAAYVRHGTVEFRQHSGSLNAEKSINWVKFCLNFVEKSRAGVTNNTPVTRPAPASRITRKHELIKELITHPGDPVTNAIHTRGATMEDLQALTGLSAATIKAYISTIRSVFNLNIRRTYDNRFYLSDYARTRRRTRRRVRTTTPVVDQDNPFTGLDAAVISYYNERIAEFSSL